MAEARPVAPADQERALVWDQVRAARNIRRPHALELLGAMATDVLELHGDRLFGDDGAIVAGLARLDGRPIVFVGQQKGADTEENIQRNFGSAHPEGFRKAIRLYRLAEKLHLPVVTLVDTAGAHPGAGAEERGIAEAIARSILTMLRLRTPIVVAIIGEGGSGGALAVAAGDVVLALEHAVYSVISPEGCASILWRTADAAPQAAAAMHMTAAEQADLGIVDRVVAEPPGGAQEDLGRAAAQLREAIVAELDRLAPLTPEQLLEARYQRYRRIGAFATTEAAPEVRVERPGLTERLRSILELGRHTLAGPDPAPDADADAGVPDAPLREEL